jgi:hypothetical protein
LKFTSVDLGRNYAGHIRDFAEVRNFFIKDLPHIEYVLLADSHEEVVRGW